MVLEMIAGALGGVAAFMFWYWVTERAMKRAADRLGDCHGLLG